MNIRVRGGLVGAWLALFAGLAPAVARADAPAPNKPNILFAFADDWGYPHAGIYGDQTVRTPSFDRNFKPERWPVGTPDPESAFIPGAWLGDADNGLTKFYLWANRDRSDVRPLYDLAYAMRPAEELYDIDNDPHQMNNVADHPRYAETRRALAEQLTQYLRRTNDPRELGTDDQMDEREYLGGIPNWPGQDVIDRYRD